MTSGIRSAPQVEIFILSLYNFLFLCWVTLILINILTVKIAQLFFFVLNKWLLNPLPPLQLSTMTSTLSMSTPITKVVKNDAYTAPAPRPPVPVAPTRPSSHMAASRAPTAALQPVSRTLQQNTAESSTAAATPPQVKCPFHFFSF